MISLKELNPHNYPTTPEIDANLEELLKRLNVLRAAYGKPLTITSGLRSNEQQQALIAAGKSNAPKSKHLRGLAADVYDPNGEFWAWLMVNMELLESTGIWLESKNATPTWTHCQIISPNSGKRIFDP
jgi:uncharacterized protein YcbK (DUF882 family)